MDYSLDKPRNLDTRESRKEKCLKFLIPTAITISVSSTCAHLCQDRSAACLRSNPLPLPSKQSVQVLRAHLCFSELIEKAPQRRLSVQRKKYHLLHLFQRFVFHEELATERMKKEKQKGGRSLLDTQIDILSIPMLIDAQALDGEMGERDQGFWIGAFFR